MAVIKLDNLVVGYGSRPVIDGLSLEIADGSFFTLLGPSGCGKTTLLRTIAGFIPVRSGRLHFGERDVTALPAHQRDIGMVFQDYALFPDKTVFDNVAYGLRARRKDAATIKRTVGEYLERVGLSAFADRMPAAMSGGQRQRVALARALAIRPTVLLMDEPLSNLDAKLRVQVRETIADLQRELAISTVFVTHDQEEAMAVSDRIGLMREGRLEQVGTPEEIYAEPVSAYVADFVGAANTIAVEIVAASDPDGFARARLGRSQLRVRTPRALGVGKAILVARGETLSLISAGNPSADSVPGRIRRRQYFGAKTTYRVAIADGVELNVEEHGDAHARRGADEQVHVVFDPGRTLAVMS
jgi:iron(III) transport system ATP-binding protein